MRQDSETQPVADDSATRCWRHQFGTPDVPLIADLPVAFSVTPAKVKKDARRVQPLSRLTGDPASSVWPI
jgi:hypothetical protein